MPPYLSYGLGMPSELLLIELIYFLVVAGSCLYIYFRTREVYTLSRHEGLFHFRNIFLYFALAYVFRLVQVSYRLSVIGLDLEFQRGFPLWLLVLACVNYFSTMAILSLAMATLTKTIKKKIWKNPLLLHAIALVSTLFVFVTRSPNVLMLAQTLALLGAVAWFLLTPKEVQPKRIFSQNKLTFLLLAVFWIVNLLAFSKQLLPWELKIILYFFSAAVFLSILLRVHKRLLPNGQKKKQA